jgi:hypothetical protein
VERRASERRCLPRGIDWFLLLRWRLPTGVASLEKGRDEGGSPRRPMAVVRAQRTAGD